jgi:hypothetical protein
MDNQQVALIIQGELGTCTQTATVLPIESCGNPEQI